MLTNSSFFQHWHEDTPQYVSEDGKTHATIWAGSYNDQKALAPPKDSWAARPEANVGIWYVKISPGGSFVLPGVTTTDKVNRVAYFIEGKTMTINSQAVRPFSAATLVATEAAEFVNPSQQASEEPLEVLILQGSPIGEPVAQHGPFVMNTDREIEQAFADYRRTQFGGWPWPQDAMVFPREKGRFALLNGVEHVPGSAAGSAAVDAKGDSTA